MNTLSLLRLISFTLLIGFAVTTKASLLGGEIYVKYAGDFTEGPTDDRRHEVLIKLYKDCESDWPAFDLEAFSASLNQTITIPVDSFLIFDPIFNCPINVGDFPNICRFVTINEKLNCPAVEFCNDIEQLWFHPEDAQGEPVPVLLPPASDWVFSIHIEEADARPLGGINNYNQFLNLDPFLNPFVHFYIETKFDNTANVLNTGPNGFPANDITVNDYRTAGIEFTDENSPAPAFCVGNRYEYKIIWEDMDDPLLLPASADDSVAFSFTNVLEGPGGNIIPYVQGFGGGRPFKSTPPVVFDPKGIITFTADEAFMSAVGIKAEKWRWSYYTEKRCIDPNGCDPNDPAASDSVDFKLRERKLIWETTRDTRFQFPGVCNDSLPKFRAQKTITFSNIVDTITGNPIEFAEFNCADTTLFFEFDRVFVQCESIESGGSDFRIARGTPQNPIDPQEIEFVTFDCGDDGNSTQFTIHLEECISPGNYILYLDKGKDNNTLVTQCGVSVPQFFSVPIHINSNFEYDFIGPDTIKTCSPSGEALLKSGVECGTYYFWEITYREEGTNFTLRDTLKDDSLNSSAIIPFNRTNNWAARRTSGPDTNKYDVTAKIGIEVAGGCYDESDPINIEFTAHPPVDVPNYNLCPEEDWPVIRMDTVGNNVGGSNQVWRFLFSDNKWRTIETDTTILNTAQSGGYQETVFGNNEFGFARDTVGKSRTVGNYVYKVELNGGQCVIRDTFQIVKEKLYADINREDAKCQGEGYWYENLETNEVFDESTLTYLWFLDGDTIKFNDTTYADSSAYFADSTGWYTMEVKKNGRCTATDTGFFDVAEYLNPPKPKCELITWNGGNIKQVFTWPAIRGAEMYQVSFDNQNTWVRANGEDRLSHTTFGKRDGLWVRGMNLEKIDTITPAPCAFGPAAFAEQCEIVIKPTNVFTPNGDGVNDVLRFDLLEFTTGSSLQIFNRWGKLVFESSDYRNDWDGGDVEAGTYYYVLDINDPDYDIRKGTITILR